MWILLYICHRRLVLVPPTKSIREGESDTRLATLNVPCRSKRLLDRQRHTFLKMLVQNRWIFASLIISNFDEIHKSIESPPALNI